MSDNCGDDDSVDEILRELTLGVVDSEHAWERHIDGYIVLKNTPYMLLPCNTQFCRLITSTLPHEIPNRIQRRFASLHVLRTYKIPRDVALIILAFTDLKGCVFERTPVGSSMFLVHEMDYHAKLEAFHNALERVKQRSYDQCISRTSYMYQ